jgi:hypothetical protein
MNFFSSALHCSTKLKLFAFALCFTAATPCVAAINDVLPADYTALPEGVNSASLYYFERTQTGPYNNGRKTSDWNVRSQISAVRLSHSMKITGMMVSPVVVVPYSDCNLSGAGIPASVRRSTGGMADSRIGAAVWFYNDKELRRYLAVNTTLIFPSGSYDAKESLNIGENRRKSVLSLGWIHGIGDSFTLDITPEIAWYGDNTSYLGNKRLEQAPTYALTAYLRYQFTPDWRAFVGYQTNQGGETRVNGVAMNDTTNSDRMYLGGTYRISPATFADLRYTQGLNFVNGFVLRDELAMRVSQLF